MKYKHLFRLRLSLFLFRLFSSSSSLLDHIASSCVLLSPVDILFFIYGTNKWIKPNGSRTSKKYIYFLSFW